MSIECPALIYRLSCPLNIDYPSALKRVFCVLHSNWIINSIFPPSNPKRRLIIMSVTYDRVEAKPIPGERCSFCGDDTAPLVKTPCCEQLICCDTSYLSYRGGGYCQFQHENESICHFHYNEKHQGKWYDCEECRHYFGENEFERIAEDRMNTPHY